MSRSLLQKMKPYYIRKALRYLKHYGPKDFLIRVRERLTPDDVPYGPWYEKHRASQEELDRQRRECAAMPVRETPLFSVVVPAWKTPRVYLTGLLDCVLGQTYPYLELVIANASPEDEEMAKILEEYGRRDSRLTVVDLPENESIAANTNAAIDKASGEFICFMDHDDLIAPDALYEASKAAMRPDIDLIYTDEDKIRDDTKGGLEHFQP
ncbi:MAG: glycosyltransferase, partial [Lachnospiraceae bacterium]|nr:glycosyltransferase [Lachnospiraceae bacterium]